MDSDNPLLPQPYGPFHYFTTSYNLAIIVTSWLVFILRLWVRHRYSKHFSKDDWFMGAALALFTAYCALVIIFMYILASGRIVLEMAKFSDTYAATVALSFWTSITLKLSLCFFFLRLLNQRWAKYTIIAATAVSTVANIAGSLVFLISCGGPRQAVTFLFMGTCESNPSMGSAAYVRAGIWFPSYTNMAVDLVFALIPIPMLLQTTLDRKQKLTVGFYLSLACLGSCCSIGKIIFTYRHATSIASYAGIARNFAAFNTGELACYIVGGCIAAYRPLLMSLGRRLGSTLSTATGRAPRVGGGTQTNASLLATHKRQSANLNAIAGIKPLNRRSMYISTAGSTAKEYEAGGRDPDFPSPMSTTSQNGMGTTTTITAGTVSKGHSAKSSRDESATGGVRFDIMDEKDEEFGRELQRRHEEALREEAGVPQLPPLNGIGVEAEWRVVRTEREPEESAVASVPVADVERDAGRSSIEMGDEAPAQGERRWPSHPAVRPRE